MKGATRTAAGIAIAAGLALGLRYASPLSGVLPAFALQPDDAFVIEPVATGLAHPWGMDFLPDGTFLVTERPGRLIRVDMRTGTVTPIEGLPEIYAEGQGGLLDVTVDPDFETTGRVFFTFAEPGDGGTAGTSAASARLVLDDGAPRLEGLRIIFRQEPKLEGDENFGSRIVVARDGTLFVTLGERSRPELAQDASNHIGAVVRVARDGEVPADNPFVGRADARPEIWSYGHANVQGADIDPSNGALWTVEEAPHADEINFTERGGNYGWPRAAYGIDASGDVTPADPDAPRFRDPVHRWDSGITPSGLVFYVGDLFPDWQGDLFLGAPAAEALIRLRMEDGKVTGEDRLIQGELGQIRDVAVGPEGALYLLTDEPAGGVFRLVPPGG